MKRLFAALIVLLLGVLLLAACAPQVQMQTIEVTRLAPATVEVEVTRLVEVTRIVEITSTPVPATATPRPFRVWTNAQVIEAFRAAGLEIGEVSPMTEADYGLNPSRAEAAARFTIPSLCPDCGGRVFDYADAAQLEIGRGYFVTLGENNKLYFSWTFVRDNILVQINGTLPESRAREYEKALNEMD